MRAGSASTSMLMARASPLSGPRITCTAPVTATAGVSYRGARACATAGDAGGLAIGTFCVNSGSDSSSRAISIGRLVPCGGSVTVTG